MDDLATQHRKRALRALTLNAAELIRHPGATEDERHDAEQAVRLVRLEVLTVEQAHADIAQARAQIRARWHQQQAA